MVFLQSRPGMVGLLDTRNPFGFDTGVMSPEQAMAALAHAKANPVPHQWLNNRQPFGGYTVSLLRGYAIGDEPRIQEQDGKPENPGNRQAAVSTYGNTIPISIGRRRFGGNVIDASAIVPRLIGTRTYTVEYEIPITDGNTPDFPSGANLGCGGDSTDSNGNPCNDGSDPCGTKTAPCPADGCVGVPPTNPPPTSTVTCVAPDFSYVVEASITQVGVNSFEYTVTSSDNGAFPVGRQDTMTDTCDPNAAYCDIIVLPQ